MGKIIIENRTGYDDYYIMEMVRVVVQQGRISNDGKQYCYFTVFGTDDFKKVGVASILNKRSDRFVVNEVSDD